MLGIEAYKILLQFILIAVLGGGISLLYQAFNREADIRSQHARQQTEHDQTIRELRQRYLTELIAQYNAAKRTRRLLRAQSMIRTDTAGIKIRIASYDELMQAVLDAQLSLEAVAHGVRAEPELFPIDSGIDRLVDSTEVYLRLLVTEYEEIMPLTDVERETIELASLPHLADFIGPYYESVEFRPNFVHPFRETLAIVQRLISQRPGSIA